MERMVVYEVGYELRMDDAEEFDYPARPRCSCQSMVLAADAEDAIVRLKQSEIGTVIDLDDPPSHVKVADVLICWVRAESVLDIA